MGKNDELRTDIRSCFKICRELDDKYEKRCRELEHISSGQDKDIGLMAKSISQLADSMSKLVGDFEEHDEKEMLKYDEIYKQQGKFMKAIWIGTGILITVVGLASFTFWIIELANNIKGVVQ